MATTVKLHNVINRWRDGSFYAYTSPLSHADTIDVIHRSLDKGTFDKNDLNRIISHYTTVDPAGIRKHADLINQLYRRLDDIGQFTDLKPEPNREVEEKTPPPGTVIDEPDSNVPMWYDPTLIFGSYSNSDTQTNEFHISAHRYQNDPSSSRVSKYETGYEIEFQTDDGWSYIYLEDTSKTP